MRSHVQCSRLRRSRLRWTLEPWARGRQARAARERKVVANVTIKRSKHVQDVATLITLQQTAPTPTRRVENVERSVFWQVRVDLLEHRSPDKGRRQEGQGRQGCRRSQDVLKRVHAVEELTTASQAASQEATMVGAIGSYFDLGSVCEGILSFRAQMRKSFQLDL